MKILSFDGGGVRGAFSASVAANLLKIDPDLYSHFDVYTGTSTGAIIATLLALGHGPETIMSMYTTHATRIFSRDIRSFRGTMNSRYKTSGFAAVLVSVLKNQTLGDIQKRLIITASNITTGEVQLFDSANPLHQSLTLIEVILASTAAPSIFDPVRIGEFLYADGGLWANDPTLPAVFLLKDEGIKFEDMRILSIGTGYHQTLYTEAQNSRLGWGIIGRWEGAKLLSLTGKLQNSEASNYLDILLKSENYYRVNFELEKGIELDDPSQVEQLVEEGRWFVAKQSNSLEMFLKDFGSISSKPWWQVW